MTKNSKKRVKLICERAFILHSNTYCQVTFRHLPSLFLKFDQTDSIQAYKNSDKGRAQNYSLLLTDFMVIWIVFKGINSRKAKYRKVKHTNVTKCS